MNIILLPAANNTCSATFVTPNDPNFVTLDDPNVVQHFNHVLKVGVGDTVKVGEIEGRLGVATVAEVTATQVVLSQIILDQAPPPKLPLTVVLAIPRPKVLRRLFLDMTAMGVSDIYLVNSYRSEKSYWQTPLLNHIDTYIKEGLQQSCDTVFPRVHFKKRLKPFVEDELPSVIEDAQAIIAHPYATAKFAEVWEANKPHVLVIGAEGGFIEYEVDLFVKAGCQTATLGARILRTENAVSVLAGFALLQA